MNKIKNFLAAMVLAVTSVAWLPGITAKAATDTCTWTGGGADDKISTAANWTGCDNGNVPQNGDSLVFPSATESVSVFNDSLTSVGSISINDGANASFFGYTITDDLTPSSLTLLGNIVVGQNQIFTINQDLVLGADILVTLKNSSSSVSIVSDSFDTGAFDITFDYIDFGLITQNSSYSVLPNVTINPGATGLLAGSGDTRITFSGVDVSWGDEAGTYIGGIFANKSVITILNDATKLGATSAGTQFINSQLNVQNSSLYTLNEPITFTGNLFGKKPTIGYEAVADPSNGITLTNVTLNSDIAADPYTANISFTGTLNGAYVIGVSQVYTVTATKGHLVINATTNTSKMLNGDYIVASDIEPITDSQPSQSIIVQAGDTVILNGTRANVIVSEGGILKGSGTVGSVLMQTTSSLSPGNSPGCINTGNLVFSGSSILEIELNNATVCTGYDQSKVTGSVSLDGEAVLNVVKLSTYKPSINTKFTIIDNDSNDAVFGTFKNLAEGSTFTKDGATYKVSYAGGDGNDVTLTVTALPGSPDTGTFRAQYTSAVVFGGLSIAAGVYLLGGKKLKLPRRRK